MIEGFKHSSSGFRKVKTFKAADWIHLGRPTSEEIGKLCSKLKLPRDRIDSLRDIDEIPLFETENGVTTIIIKTPLKNIRGLDYATVPIGVFIVKGKVLTVCFFDSPALTQMKAGLKASFSTTMFLLKLLMSSSKLYLSYLKEINVKTDRLERELEKSQKNKEILELLDIEKSLVYFTTSLRSDYLILEKLSRSKEIIKSEKDNDFILDVLGENRQAIEMTTIHSDILSNTMDAFASIISNNLNIVMKKLAAITIILSIPIFVASVYGMNIELPFQHSVHAFLIVMFFSALLSFFGVGFFLNKKFF